LYNPIYTVIYNTLCGVAGGSQSCMIATGTGTGSGAAAVAPNPSLAPVVNVTATGGCAPGATLCVTISNGQISTNKSTAMLMAIAGGVGAVTIGIIAFICWKFYCGAAKKDAPLMDLNY